MEAGSDGGWQRWRLILRRLLIPRSRVAQRARPFLLVLFVLCLLPAANQATLARAQRAEEKTMPDLYVDMLIGPPLVPAFNHAARPDDIAHIYLPQQLPQLEDIERAQKMLIFRSVQEAQEQLPPVAALIDVIGYNIEHGPGTPPEDQADPAAAAQAMRQLADDYDLKFAIGPDHDFALSHGPAMAPYADYFVLQVQRQQSNPPVVVEFVSTLVPKLRAANAQLQISVQVRSEGEMTAIVDLLDALLSNIDGVSILTSPDTVDNAEELLSLLRGEGQRVFLPMITAAGED